MIRRLSLLWKILLSTSICLTLLFVMTGWIVQDYAIRTTSQSLDDEVKASFQAYESLWQSRAERLASLSLLLSRMSDVRAAFGTHDQATILDTAQEVWSKMPHENAIFVVADPRGAVVASLGAQNGLVEGQGLSMVRAAANRFPGQASGFAVQSGRLFQIVVTPVYVDAGGSPGLLNVLVAGYVVDNSVAERLKEATGGSDFRFVSGGRVLASTTKRDDVEYKSISTPLNDIEGKPVGELRIMRSFAAAKQRISALQRNIIGIWLVAILLGLGSTYTLARRILEPVRELDRGASEIARGNYEYRVPVDSRDELGRLAETFNAMCASIQGARQELIRQERISTIGRLSTSIVHDLRNPLAAIYGGAEMLVDGELPPAAIERLARNIYRASRRVQELLQEMVDVSRGKTQPAETCRLADVIRAAYESHAAPADTQGVTTAIEVPDDIELPMERARMERVFLNLIGNAIEAMPDGGSLKIEARKSLRDVTVTIEDSGPGVAAQIRPFLFQPFTSAGKKNGVGLGLALSHQAVIDHGGELWLDPGTASGARFCMRLPLDTKA